MDEGAPGDGDGDDPVGDAGSVERRKKHKHRDGTAGWTADKAIGDKIREGGTAQQTADRDERCEVREAQKSFAPGGPGAMEARRNFEKHAALQLPRIGDSVQAGAGSNEQSATGEVNSRPSASLLHPASRVANQSASCMSWCTHRCVAVLHGGSRGAL